MIPITYKFIRNKLDRRLKSFRKKVHQRFHPIREKVSSKLKFSKTRVETSPSITEPKIEEEKSFKTKLKRELKNYVIATLKSPFTIVGLGIIIYLGVIATFPQLFTIYSLNNITLPDYLPETPFLPPSPDHPLGTTMYGFDLLARIIYGIRGTLIFGSIVTLIGLVGGAIFGFAAGSLHRYVHKAIVGSMLILFIIPGLILLSLSVPIFRVEERILSIMTIGILSITFFTGIIANAIRRESNSINVIKVIIKHIPLEMAFAIMLYQMLGFIGITDESAAAQLGETIQYGRGQWGDLGKIYWPGFYLFLIMLGLLLLHEGLNAPTTSRVILIEPVFTY
jgi:ABC-type dipeptide/oligopeptide/nickel transport system permease subunit